VLTELGRRAQRWADAGSPWTNVYGTGRSLIALSSALTLAFNQSTTLWRPIAGVAMKPPFCGGRALQKASLYCVMPTHLDAARWIGVIVLLVVASGWRPRFTALFHWWVAVSFQLTASTLEGGDQAAAVLTLLLIPVAITDPRKWHWEPSPSNTSERTFARSVTALIALAALLVVRLQVCGIYFHAAFGKLQGTEWADGTAMYYWLSNPTFGATRFLSSVLRPILSNSALLASVTWGTIIVELFLFMGLAATRSVKRVLLVLGISLHLGVLIFMGLVSFSLTMFGALVLYLRPSDEPFAFSLPGKSFRFAGWKAALAPASLRHEIPAVSCARPPVQ
jgi:antimicrobial peptide system SdpB family protein